METAREATPVIFNVGGTKFKTRHSTLQRFPNSKLAKLSTGHASYDSESGEYFFDRNPRLFEIILDLYRLGVLHYPSCICTGYLREEMDFWGVDVSAMAECCSNRYNLADEQNYVSSHLERVIADHDEEIRFSNYDLFRDKTLSEKAHNLRMKIWQFLEDPGSSLQAKVWGVFFLLVVTTSVIIQCGMTSPSFRIPIPPRINITNETNPKMLMYLTTDLHPVCNYLDLCCLFIFSLELSIRFIVCQEKLRFFTCMYNIIDCISTFVMIFMLVFEIIYPDFWGNDTQFTIAYIVQAFSVFRALRLVKFARHYKGVRLLLLAIRASSREIILLILIFSIGTLVFSNMIYYAEFYSTENDFHSIPIGFWWAIVTMTTVGYGDKHPRSAWGYVVGAVCAMSGMLFTGLPIPIIANNFNLIYSYERRRRIHQAHQEIHTSKNRESSSGTKLTDVSGADHVGISVGSEAGNSRCQDQRNRKKGSAVDITGHIHEDSNTAHNMMTSGAIVTSQTANKSM